MIDFPSAELFDDSICLIWLERRLHPNGFTCPHCGSTDRRLFRQQRYLPAYCCRTCDDYYTLLSGRIAESVPVDSSLSYPDEWQSYCASHPAHATVCHSADEWARDDDGDGRQEVHCNTCEGAGAALRTYLRVLRGVHKQYLHLYVATYEAMVNTKRVTPELIRRMCVGNVSVHTGYA